MLCEHIFDTIANGFLERLRLFIFYMKTYFLSISFFVAPFDVFVYRVLCLKRLDLKKFLCSWRISGKWIWVVDMGLFGGLFGPKKKGGHEIKETVRCAKCGRKMHLPKELLQLSLGNFSITKGSQCVVCKKYYCNRCTYELDKPGWSLATAGSTFRCCGSGFYFHTYIE